MSSKLSLPSPSSPAIVLTNPTPDERARTWSYSYPEWGHGLTLQGYLDREAYLLTIPLARHGGITNWILTDTDTDAGTGTDSVSTSSAVDRPVLASCETLRKRAIARGKDGIVRDVWAHGVASVFTYEEFRGRGYAGKMMALLRDRLARLQQESGEAVCSVLFSDIGKKFYAKAGWIPMGNTHLEFPAAAREAEEAITTHDSVKIVRDDDLPALAEVDERLLRRELEAPSAEDASKIRVAVCPDLDTFLWQFRREDFICNLAFGRKPTVRGAVYTPPASPPNTRVWALWVRNYYGGVEKPENNILSFIRFVVEDASISDEDLSSAINSILGVARNEARDWHITKIQMWNPSERVRRLVEQTQGLDARFVVREDSNIASINWFGEGSVDDVEWVANEKYVWC
ncbi:hypothetical protein PT974_12102 [Cladobotryum mycophilum]|uniref:LYC1 C-terminal domain-containing protein n=1 Tax=Cladobotryum mycophilum TaxID=491253 RepID=A0ABR0S8J5_9HYPO